MLRRLCFLFPLAGALLTAEGDLAEVEARLLDPSSSQQAPAKPAAPKPPAAPSTGQVLDLDAETLDGREPVFGEPKAEEPPLEIPELPDLSLLENAHVLVVGDHYSDVRYVYRLCESLLQFGSRYLPMPEAFASKVVVRIIPDPGDEGAPYALRMMHGTEVNLYLRWGKRTRYEDLCQGLSRAFLRAWALTAKGAEQLKDVPPWLVLAFGKALEMQSKPSLRDHLAEQSKAYPTLTLEQVLDPTSVAKLELETLTLHAWWLFEWLEAESGSRLAFSSFLRRVLLEDKTTVEQIAKHFKEARKPEDRELWWAVGVQSEVQSSSAPILNFAESRELIERLAYLDVELDGADHRLDLDQVWAKLEHEAVHRAALWRLREIKVEMHRINPVYFNAVHSLGAVWETYLNSQRHPWLQAVHWYEKDLKEANRLAERIEGLFEK